MKRRPLKHEDSNAPVADRSKKSGELGDAKLSGGLFGKKQSEENARIMQKIDAISHENGFQLFEKIKSTISVIANKRQVANLNPFTSSEFSIDFMNILRIFPVQLIGKLLKFEGENGKTIVMAISECEEPDVLFAYLSLLIQMMDATPTKNRDYPTDCFAEGEFHKLIPKKIKSRMLLLMTDPKLTNEQKSILYQMARTELVYRELVIDSNAARKIIQYFIATVTDTENLQKQKTILLNHKKQL